MLDVDIQLVSVLLKVLCFVQSSEPKREERKQESSWNSQSLPRSNSSSRSRSQSPHEARLAQQKRIEQSRAAKPRGESPQSSYYNSNRKSFDDSGSGGGKPSDNGARKDFGERAGQAVNQLGDGIRGGSSTPFFLLFFPHHNS